jgi:hypothetical protein
MSNDSKKLSQVVSIGEGKFQSHLDELVRGTVEQTLNAMLQKTKPAVKTGQAILVL